MVELILNALLFGLPLLVVPFIQFPYELPKVIVAQILIFILFVYSVQQIKFRTFFKNKNLVFVVAAVFALSLLGFGTHFNSQIFFGNAFRLQGVFLLWTLLLFMLTVSSLPKIRVHERFSIVTLILLFISSLILSHPLTHRAVGTLGEANALAAVAVALWCYSLNFERKLTSRDKLPMFLSFILAMGVVGMSGSSSGLLAIVGQIVLIALVKFVGKKPLVFTAVAVVLLCVSSTLVFQDDSRIYENRAEIWQTAVKAGLDSPLIGHGFGNISVPLRTASVELSNNVRFQNVDSSHNIFLDWFVQGGIVGVALLVGTLLFAMYRMAVVGDGRMIMLFGLLVTLSFNPASVVSLVLLFWLIGTSFRKLV